MLDLQVVGQLRQSHRIHAGTERTAEHRDAEWPLLLRLAILSGQALAERVVDRLLEACATTLGEPLELVGHVVIERQRGSHADIMMLISGDVKMLGDPVSLTVGAVKARAVSEIGSIVGLNVTNVGSDMGSLTPMLDDIERRTGELPGQLLADANHTAHDLRAVAARDVELLAPVPERTRNSDKSHDEPIADWIRRMQTPEAKRMMRARASLCELANAHVKDRFGLDQIRVRGAAKVTCVVLLGSLAFNLLQHANSLLA